MNKLLDLKKQTIDFFFELACKEHEAAEKTYGFNDDEFIVHIKNHELYANRFLKECNELKLILKGLIL